MDEHILEKRMVQSYLAITAIACGLLLLAYLIVIEDEPGAVPLLLIVFGSVWYLIIRKGRRSEIG